MLLCECGCGRAVTVAPYPCRRQARFISGHNKLVGLPPEYAEEDRGYETPCWIWQRRMSQLGYGVRNHNGKIVLAHRENYIAMVGDPGKRVHLHHLCKVRRCVNPAHLAPRTPAEHAADHHPEYLEARRKRSPLDWEKVREIRSLRHTVRQVDLARMYGVTDQAIRMIRLNRVWVDPDYVP